MQIDGIAAAQKTILVCFRLSARYLPEAFVVVLLLLKPIVPGVLIAAVWQLLF